jgi:uncharacterized protein YdaU (DUF1376 family)
MCEFAYLKFYPGDFLADTLDLDRADIGSYMLLLMAMWRQDGSLPLEPRGLAKIARASVRHWTETWGRLKRFFVVSEDGATITQKRLVEELQEARKRAKAPKPKTVTEVGKMPASLASKPLTDNNVAPQHARATPEPERKKESKGVIGTGAISVGAVLPRFGLSPIPKPETRPLYEPHEIAALETCYGEKIPDIPKRVAGIVEWCLENGITRENEIKKAVWGRFRKEVKTQELHAERIAA